MPKLQNLLEYNMCENDCNAAVPVVVVAAGSSQRMGGIDKQLTLLNSVPVIIRTLKAFENSPYISKIIVVTKQESILPIQQLCEKYMITKISDIVLGGKDRHESVLNGLELLSCDEDKVLVHDGARPLVSSEIIKGSVLALEEADCIVCAIKVNDTVKKADGKGCVEKTVDRTDLYCAQTPQGFNVGLYKKASAAAGDKSVFTDDASVMESAGYTVKIVGGSPYNIKITTRQDIKLAELYLGGEMV